MSHLHFQKLSDIACKRKIVYTQRASKATTALHLKIMYTYSQCLALPNNGFHNKVPSFLLTRCCSECSCQAVFANKWFRIVTYLHKQQCQKNRFKVETTNMQVTQNSNKLIIHFFGVFHSETESKAYNSKLTPSLHPKWLLEIF